MSAPGRGRARGRAGRGGDNAGAPPRRPGEKSQQQQLPRPPPQQPQSSVPTPQPSSAWGPPAATAAVRAGAPTASGQGGRASHRSTPTTHLEHPGDVDVQQRMLSMQIGETDKFNLFISVYCLTPGLAT